MIGVVGGVVGVVIGAAVETVNIKTISKYYKTGATSGTGTAHPSGLLTCCWRGSCCSIFSFLCSVF